MIYRIVHRSTYKYRSPVSVGNHVACLKPRPSPPHQLMRSELRIHPAPATRTERVDYFGNLPVLLHGSGAAQGTDGGGAERSGDLPGSAAPWPQHGLRWEEVADSLAGDLERTRGWRPTSLCLSRRASGCGRSLPRMRCSRLRRAADAGGAAGSDRAHSQGFPLRFQGDECADARRRRYFKKRRGVCQDFAHVQIACLRSLNLAARYVSGYLRTYPPPGKPRLVGADASHAWVSAYCPGAGGSMWIPPTTSCRRMGT